MAVSVTQRPAAYCAAKNPVIYKFETTGGPFTDYRIEVEVFNASNDASLGPKLSVSPNQSGASMIDISAILRANLTPDWKKPAAPVESDTDGILGFYIKYQELYTGSSTSVNDDKANSRNAILGALQIPAPNGNDLGGYVTGDEDKKFLTVFDIPKVWRGFPGSISIIMNDEYEYMEEQFDAAGNKIGGTVTHFSNNNLARVSPGLNTLNDLAKTLKVSLQKNNYVVDDDTGVTSPIDQTVMIGETIPAGTYRFHGGVVVIGTVSSLSVQAFVGDGVNEVELTVMQGPTPNSRFFYGTTETSIPFDFDRFRFTITETSGSPFAYDFRGGILEAVSEFKTVAVDTPCKNPVMLVWRNSLGGDACWLFEHDQEVSYTTSGKKAKRMQLSARDLTEDQWHALNELNHLGEVYKQNIVELTSTVDKSHVRDGTQVYVVDSAGNKTGVIVIPTSNAMFTRMSKHEFRIEIEFPEIYE